MLAVTIIKTIIKIIKTIINNKGFQEMGGNLNNSLWNILANSGSNMFHFVMVGVLRLMKQYINSETKHRRHCNF